jgi:hypothetical protein
VPSRFVICGDSIAARLRELCKGRQRTSDNLQLIRDMSSCWDEWTYALDFCPNGIRRRWVRKRR